MNDFLKYGNGHKFDGKPQFNNHQCHWAPWADHYQNDPDYEKAMLANMLGFSLEENARLLKRTHGFADAKTKLFFAFIELVDRLCPWCARKTVPFVSKDSDTSIKGAWSSIQRINLWRSKNKLNIKEVDYT